MSTGNNYWWAALFPLVFGVCIALGLTAGIYYLKRRIGRRAKILIVALAVVATVFAYAIAFQELIGRLF